MRVKSEVQEIRQLVKMHKKLYSRFRPHKEYKREYRNRNARKRMMKKTWELIVKKRSVVAGQILLGDDRLELERGNET